MTDIDLTGIKVGDTVYIVSSDQRETPHEAVVTIVGRKYITVDNGYYSKFSKEDGFCTEWSQWRLYPSGSVEAYKAAEGWSTYASRIQAIPT